MVSQIHPDKESWHLETIQRVPFGILHYKDALLQRIGNQESANSQHKLYMITQAVIITNKILDNNPFNPITSLGKNQISDLILTKKRSTDLINSEHLAYQKLLHITKVLVNFN